MRERRGRVPAVSGIGWAALGVLAFSFTFPATTLAERGGFAPLLVGAGRSVTSGVIAAVCLACMPAPRPARSHWPGLIAVAGGCGIGFGVLTALALRHTSSSHAAVVVGLLPAATASFAVLRGGERPKAFFWVASLGGTAAVTAYAISRGSGSLRGGDLLLLASVAVAAVGYAEGGRLTRMIAGWRVTAWGLVLALPVSTAITAAALAHGVHLKPSLSAVAGFAYVGTISTFVGFFAWYQGLAEAGIARASQVQLLQPLLTIAWSAPLLGDHLDATGFVTAAVVGLCVLVTQRARLRPGDGPEAARAQLRRP